MIQKKKAVICIEEEARSIAAASPRLCGLGGAVKKPSEAERGTRDTVEEEQEIAERQIHSNLLYNRGIEGNERFAAEGKCGPKLLCSNSGRYANGSIATAVEATFSVLIFQQLVSLATVADIAWVTVGRSGANSLMRCVFSVHDNPMLICLHRILETVFAD